MTRTAMTRALLLPALLLSPVAAGAGEIRGALVTLEVLDAARPGHEPHAVPLRFALLDKGRVFVGGGSGVWHGQLDGDARKEIEKRVDRLLKQKGLATEARLGPGETRYRLYFGERDFWVIATGEPSRASAEHQRLAELIELLADFDHPSLRPWRPDRLLLGARRGQLSGGCRPWSFDLDVRALTRQPTAIPSQAASGWPTGAAPASVCHGGETYVVTLRPLLPGES